METMAQLCPALLSLDAEGASTLSLAMIAIMIRAMREEMIRLKRYIGNKWRLPRLLHLGRHPKVRFSEVAIGDLSHRVGLSLSRIGDVQPGTMMP